MNVRRTIWRQFGATADRGDAESLEDTKAAFRARQRELDLQERAIELDTRDSGGRYERLRQIQQLDAIERQLRLNSEFLEELDRARRLSR